LPFEFKVLDSPVINAFAVPGGYVYVTRGSLSYFNNEAELTGVIGHEIGHVAARHSAQQYTRAQLAQLGLGLGSILSEGFQQYAGLAQFGVSTLFLKFSRDNERQADDLGVEYATKAGFDASQMVNFFTTLEGLHPPSDRSGLPGWFSTHPNPQDRIGAVQRKAQAWAQRLGPGNLQLNRDAYLHQIDGLVFGEDPRQGYVADDVFYHPELRFQFPVPAGWKLNNTPTQVQVMSKKQDGIILFSVERGASPEAVARQFIAKSKARVIRFDRIAVNGLPAHRVISHMTTQQGAIRVMSYFIDKDGRIYVFHGFTSQPLFQSYASVFANTMGGFKPVDSSH
jgi:predicted Zn-dependent protease